MKQFFHDFWYTLNHPEEWHSVSAILVLGALGFLLMLTFDEALWKLYRF